MHAEFDTVAEWTADVALALGTEHHLPAACRGSGSPAALTWLLDHLAIGEGTTLLDSGAGVGGPAAFAVQRRGALPLLVDPEPGACRAARRLFGLPTARGSGTVLPCGDASFEVAWSLGVLCTTDDQQGMLRELARVVTATGRVGLLVFVERRRPRSPRPVGNDFPTPARIVDLVARAGLQVEAWTSAAALEDVPADWQARTDTVDAELERRYGARDEWQTAQRQSEAIAALLADGSVSAELVALRRA
jgi:SAM-dependent methyltransferase